MSTQEDYSPEYLAENRGGTLIVVCSVLMVLMTLAVGGRLLVRTRKNLEIRAEDWLVVPAFVFAFAVCVFSIASVTQLGVGRHMAYLLQTRSNPSGIIRRFNFAHHVLSYSGAQVFGKISILVFYRRIFTHLYCVRYICWVTGAFVVALGFVVFLSPFVVCQPMDWLFEGQSPHGHCIGWQWYLTYISVPNICTDLVLITLPFPVLWRLNMNLGQKIGLTFAFTLGGLNIFSSCLRFYHFIHWASNIDADTSWNAVEPALWNTIEVNTLVIVACIPHLRPLIQLIVPRTPPRERLHEVTRPARKIPCYIRNFLKKLRPDDDTRAWWRSKRMNARSMIVRGFETWEEIPSANEEEKAKEERAAGNERTARWVEDLESGLEKERPPPPDSIIMVEEVVIVSESAPRSRFDGID